jgi:hypothetical protein
MSEDLMLKISADVSDLKRALAEVVASNKNVGQSAKEAGDKAEKSFNAMGRNVSLAMVGMKAFHVAIRGLREGFVELEKAAGENSLVNGKLKQQAVVAEAAIKTMKGAFDEFAQTAASAMAPVVDLIANDLTNGLRDSTQAMKDSTSAADDGASGWAVFKTVVQAATASFGIFFQLAKGGLATLIGAAGIFTDAFGKVAGLFSKETGDAFKNAGTVMKNTAMQMYDEVGNSFRKNANQLTNAVTGELYESTMKSYERLRQGTAKKAEEIQKDLAAIAAKGKGGKGGAAGGTGGGSDDEARELAVNKAVNDRYKSLLQESALLDRITSGPEAERLRNLEKYVEAQKSFKKFNEDMLKNIEDQAEQIRLEGKMLQEELAVKEKIWKMDSLIRGTYTKGMMESNERGSGVYDGPNGGARQLEDAAAQARIAQQMFLQPRPEEGPNANQFRTRMQGNLRPDAMLEAPGDALGFEDQTREDNLKARKEFLEQTAAMAEENAEELLRIDDELNGTLEQQRGAMRAREIINDKKTSKLRQTTWQEDAGALSSTLRDMATISEAFGKKGFEAAKIFGAAAIAVETIIAAQRAFSAGAAIDAKLGTPLVFATSMAAIAATAGAVNAAKMASQSYSGGGASAGGGPGTSGITVPSDTSNGGGPGNNGGTSTINVSLIGERFGAQQVRGLMDQIREESKDGKRLTKVNVL